MNIFQLLLLTSVGGVLYYIVRRLRYASRLESEILNAEKQALVDSLKREAEIAREKADNLTNDYDKFKQLNRDYLKSLGIRVDDPAKDSGGNGPDKV